MNVPRPGAERGADGLAARGACPAVPGERSGISGPGTLGPRRASGAEWLRAVDALPECGRGRSIIAAARDASGRFIPGVRRVHRPDLALTDGERRVARALALLVDDGGSGEPGVERLAAHADVARNTITLALAKLERHGYLVRAEQWTRGRYERFELTLPDNVDTDK